MRNFKSYLVGVILEEQIKVTCKDKHSHMCSKGQGVRGMSLGSVEKKNCRWCGKPPSSAKCCFRTSPKQQCKKSYSYAARHKPQSREIGSWSIQLENTGLHQIRANKELDKSQQASHCLRKQMFMQHITLQHQGEGFLGTFHTWKHVSSHPWLACLIPVLPPRGDSTPHRMALKLLPHMTEYLQPWATSSEATSTGCQSDVWNPWRQEDKAGREPPRVGTTAITSFW